jgi:hypothetical protein
LTRFNVHLQVRTFNANPSVTDDSFTAQEATPRKFQKIIGWKGPAACRWPARQ